MKIIGTIASIKKDSNKLISATFADWSAVREGTFLKFQNDLHFYTVHRVDRRIYIKDFEVISPNTIKVNEDVGLDISEQDTLNISFKEYELNTIHRIVNGGWGFKIGDNVIFNGGVPSLNTRDNILENAVLDVVRIGSRGEIIEIKIANRGKYIEPPPTTINLNTNDGSGALIEASYKLANNRTFTERDVDRIEYKSGETIIYLVYPLLGGIKNGKLSAEKWEITLSSNYNGENKINEEFQIIRDFTPNYKMPLLAQNSQNQELMINRSVTILDNKIKELEDRIKKLEGI